MTENKIWDCIHEMEALCSRNDLSSVSREDLEKSYLKLYDQLTAIVL